MSAEIWWGVAGVAMIIADLVFGTFFILFVGAGALITAILIWAGVLPDPTWQWVVFAATSTAGLVLLRKRLVTAFGRGSKDEYDEHRGQKVQITEDIPANGIGRVSYRGATWQARSVNGESIPSGTNAIIRKTDGIILEIEPSL
jgi:inner membrane protein